MFLKRHWKAKSKFIMKGKNLTAQWKILVSHNNNPRNVIRKTGNSSACLNSAGCVLISWWSCCALCLETCSSCSSLPSSRGDAGGGLVPKRWCLNALVTLCPACVYVCVWTLHSIPTYDTMNRFPRASAPPRHIDWWQRADPGSGSWKVLDLCVGPGSSNTVFIWIPSLQTLTFFFCTAHHLVVYSPLSSFESCVSLCYRVRL